MTSSMSHGNRSAPGLCVCERVSQLTSDRAYFSFESESIPRQTSSAHTQTMITWHQRPCTRTREAHWIGVVRCFCRWHLPETLLSRLLETSWAFRGWKHHERRPSPRHQNDTVHPMSSVTITSVCVPRKIMDYTFTCLEPTVSTNISYCAFILIKSLPPGEDHSW